MGSARKTGIKRKALSISDKLDILNKYDDGCAKKRKQKKIAEELGIPPSTLRTILKNRLEIQKNGRAGGSNKQKVKHGKYEELEKVLVDWFRQARALNYPLNGVIIEKAKEIAKRLNLTEFYGSTGWLDRFRSRNNIVYRQISEKPSKDPSNPDFVPAVFDVSAQNTKKGKRKKEKVLAIPHEVPTRETAKAWSAVLNLQPIESEASASGVDVHTQPQLDATEPASSEPEHSSPQPADPIVSPQPADPVVSPQPADPVLSPQPAVSKPKEKKLKEPKEKKLKEPKEKKLKEPKEKKLKKPKEKKLKEPKESPKKRVSKPIEMCSGKRKVLQCPSPPANVPVESHTDPLRLCIVKMEIEDDGYNENEHYLASLPSTSYQPSPEIQFGDAPSIKLEPSREMVPTVFKIVPTPTVRAASSDSQTVEAFFKNVADTVKQFPPHLIEKTKTKVSSLVYDMVIQAISEGCTNIQQPEL